MSAGKLYLVIVGIMSVLLFAMMGADKAAARSRKRRIPEARLFLLALLGGTLGMLTFRHKTRRWYFRLFFPLLSLIQLFAAIWLYCPAC